MYDEDKEEMRRQSSAGHKKRKRSLIFRKSGASTSIIQGECSELPYMIQEGLDQVGKSSRRRFKEHVILGELVSVGKDDIQGMSGIASRVKQQHYA